MKVVIIEDESLSAELLTTLLHRLDPSIEVIVTLDSIRESVGLFRSGLVADLIFLDIHLADGLGFELFSQVKIDTPVVFTTAYSEYAIKAFEVNSIDYLLKPIGLADLKRAIEKYQRYNPSGQPALLSQIAEAYRQINKQYKTRFMVRSGTIIDSIKVEEVSFFTTTEGVTFLFAGNGKRYPVDYTLDQLEQMLEPSGFFRINRKVILSIRSIGKVNTYLNGRLIVQVVNLEGDATVVSRERVNDFKRWLDQ